MRGNLDELGERWKSPTTVNQETLKTFSWTGGVKGLRTVKGIGVKYQYFRYEVEDKTFAVRFRPSLDNKADSLTKILEGALFQTHRTYAGVPSLLHCDLAVVC